MERCRLGWPGERISIILGRIGGFMIVENMIHNINSTATSGSSQAASWSGVMDVRVGCQDAGR